MGAPEIAQAELDGLIKQDRSGVLNWIRSGAAKATQYTVDWFRRAKLEERLSETTHEAETARAGLAGIDADIEFAEAVVQILEKRHSKFVRATVQEAALPRVAEFNETAHRLQGLIASLAGVGKVTDIGRFSGRDNIEVRLPQLGNTTTQLVVDRHEIDRAANPWRDLEKRLTADPRATLSVEAS